MPRERAQIRLSRWSDDDVRDLTPAEQHLYLVLTLHPELSYCGVVDWRPRRIAALAAGWTEDSVRAAAAGLVDKLFLVVDEDTEECLLRPWVRDDELMKQPRMATAMATAYSAVVSRRLRGVIVHELLRLREDEPELKGWGSEAALALLSKGSVDPSVNPSPNGSTEGSGEGSGEGSVNPSVKGKPKGSVKGSVKGGPTSSSSSTSIFLLPDDSLRSPRDAPATATAQDVTAAWIDAYRTTGAEPTKSAIAQVGKTAKELLTANEPNLVLEAAQVAGARGYATIDRQIGPLAASRSGRSIVRPLPVDPNTGMAVDF